MNQKLIEAAKDAADWLADVHTGGDDECQAWELAERLNEALKAEPEVVAEPMRVRYERMASVMGWKAEDGEGVIEFLMRTAMATGHQDAINDRATHGPHYTKVGKIVYSIKTMNGTYVHCMEDIKDKIPDGTVVFKRRDP